MINQTFTFLLILVGFSTMAQPTSFNYQTVVRNASGEIISNQSVSFQISILQGSATGTAVYVETNSATTNQFALASLEIGNGTIVSGDFTSINWGADDYFLQVELDETGGTNYQFIGVSQLLAVPYALHSSRANQAEDDDWLESDTNLYVTVPGNVGIGTQTPRAKLEVDDMLRLTPSTYPKTCLPDLEGSIYYDDFYNEYCYCDGNNWQQLDRGGFCECVDLDNDGYDICDPGHPYDSDGYPTDCDDDEPMANPGQQEVCDEIDNNCDGLIDNEAIDAIVFYPDNDGDEYGDDMNTIMACTQPPGYVDIGGDCDDSEENTYPGAPEICDEKDNDCDQEIDEEAIDAIQYYLDADNDGWGDDNNYIWSCWVEPGYTDLPGDCDDTNFDINPGAIEICNGIDENCDQEIDNGADCSAPNAAMSCAGSSGCVIDYCLPPFDDCNGDPLDGCETDLSMLPVFFKDDDQDGYGDPDNTIQGCGILDPPFGYVENDLDCDDTDPDVNPEAIEICDDNIDNDCDGWIDMDDPDCN